MGVEGRISGLLKPAAPAVGVDIGSHSIKIVVLKKASGAEADFSATAGEFFLDSGLPDSVASGLLFLRDDFGLSGRKAAVAVSGGSVFTTPLKVPASCAGCPKMTEEAVCSHLSKFFPGGMEAYGCGFYQYPESPEDIVAAVVKKEAVSERATALSESGIIPAVIDYEGFAVINAYNHSFERGPVCGDSDGLTVLLNIGHSLINFSVLEDSKTVFTRDIFYGSGKLTSEIALLCNMKADEAESAKTSLCETDDTGLLDAARNFSLEAAREVRCNLEMFADLENKKVAKVVLSGGGSLLHGLSDTFSEILGADVEYADPLKGFSAGDEGYLSGLSPKTAVAFGLALRMTD